VVLKSTQQQRDPKINFREIFRVARFFDLCNNIRHKRPIRNGRLGENKGQGGFDTMVFGSL